MSRGQFEQSNEIDRWLSAQGRDRFEIISEDTMPKAIRASLQIGNTLDERRALYDVFSQLYGSPYPQGAGSSPQSTSPASAGSSSPRSRTSQKNLSGQSQSPQASPRARTSGMNLSGFTSAPRTALDETLGRAPQGRAQAGKTGTKTQTVESQASLEPGMTNAFPHMQKLSDTNPEAARVLSKIILGGAKLTVPILGKLLPYMAKKSPMYDLVFGNMPFSTGGYADFDSISGGSFSSHSGGDVDVEGY